jgi:hypothetical protein
VKVTCKLLCSGERCPCGSWVTPAFHVQKSKVDACHAAVVAAVTSTRCPVAAPSSVGAVGMHFTSSHSSSVNQQMSELTVLDSPDGQRLPPSPNKFHSEHRDL